jgi:hypothetical protein
MQNKNSGPLKVSLHGMNNRMQKMMANYLEISCNGIAYVVDENEAQAEIVDIDLVNSKTILKERLAQQPSKPIIALSLQEISNEKVIYVKKPIEIPKVINALKEAKKKIKVVKTNKAPNSSKTKIKETPLPTTTKPRLVSKTKTNKQTASALQKNNTLNKKVAIKTPNNKPNTAVSKQQLNKDNLETKITKSVKVSNSQKNSKPFSINILEIDRLLRELRNPFKRSRPSIKKKEFSVNNRKTVRYAFQPIEANLKKRSFTGNKRFGVLIKNLSSRGAVIELNNPTKLRGKVILKIMFDSSHIFVIPAKIARKEGSSIYGLQFLKNQHELLDFQIDSGQSFVFS